MKSKTAAGVQRRRLGRTGLEVSAIGFGAWGIGKAWWGPTDDAESLKALRRTLELGINFFDTAYVYGDGHSERLIARAFQEAGRRALVATKVPPKNFQWPSRGALAEAFPPGWIQECTERSLKNLGVETLEIQQFHVWQDSWLAEPAWDKTLKTVEALKRQGKIRFWGISINSRLPKSALELVRSGLVDTVQVIFNLFEQEPTQDLFAACREKDVGVIARVPFDEGGLTGGLTEETRFPEGDFRRDYFAGGLLGETVRRAGALEKLLVKEDVPNLAAAALRFCLSFPEVSTVIPGMRRAAHVEANALASRFPPYPPAMLKKLRAHAWKRNLKDP